MKKIIYTFPLIFVLAACAKHTSEIQAQYVSPLQYQDYNCRQLQIEMSTISDKLSRLGVQVDKTASNDSAQMGIGLVLLWPTLFFLDGDTPEAAEYAHLKGQYEAVEHAVLQKNCNGPAVPGTRSVNQNKR